MSDDKSIQDKIITRPEETARPVLDRDELVDDIADAVVERLEDSYE